MARICRKGIWLVLLACSVAISCVVPIQNIQNEPIVTATKGVSASQIQKAIIKAGSKRGWRIRPIGSGQLQGSLRVRAHTATVLIRFNTKKYSITYKDSTNLKSDGARIHGNYNKWVATLSQDINFELSQL